MADASKILLTEGDAPAAPAVGVLGIYTKIDDKIYKKNSAGAEEAVWSGSTPPALSAKNPPIDADKAIYRDSAAADALVTSTWAQIKAFLGLVITAGKTITCTENTSLDEAVAMSSKAPKTSTCAFLAFANATVANQTGNGATANVGFNTEVFDLGSNFATNTFTAPVTGKYQLNVQVTMVDLTAAMTAVQLYLNTTNRSYYYDNQNANIALGQVPAAISVLADMDAGETATVQIRIVGGAGDTADVLGHASILYTFFSGHLVSQ